MAVLIGVPSLVYLIGFLMSWHALAGDRAEAAELLAAYLGGQLVLAVVVAFVVSKVFRRRPRG